MSDTLDTALRIAGVRRLIAQASQLEHAPAEVEIEVLQSLLGLLGVSLEARGIDKNSLTPAAAAAADFAGDESGMAFFKRWLQQGLDELEAQQHIPPRRRN
ncbi:hypothetical protein E2F47_25890 [Mycobacterium eburneum]|nr:hypothetical protein E2F47_25890 [Mycobacterium eburneum]